jgi:nucleoside diphosphate kinase
MALNLYKWLGYKKKEEDEPVVKNEYDNGRYWDKPVESSNDTDRDSDNQFIKKWLGNNNTFKPDPNYYQHKSIQDSTQTLKSSGLSVPAPDVAEPVKKPWWEHITDPISSLQYGLAHGIKNAVDDNPDTKFLKGVGEGFKAGWSGNKNLDDRTSFQEVLDTMLNSSDLSKQAVGSAITNTLTNSKSSKRAGSYDVFVNAIQNAKSALDISQSKSPEELMAKHNAFVDEAKNRSAMSGLKLDIVADPENLLDGYLKAPIAMIKGTKALNVAESANDATKAASALIDIGKEGNMKQIEYLMKKTKKVLGGMPDYEGFKIAGKTVLDTKTLAKIGDKLGLSNIGKGLSAIGNSELGQSFNKAFRFGKNGEWINLARQNPDDALKYIAQTEGIKDVTNRMLKRKSDVLDLTKQVQTDVLPEEQEIITKSLEGIMTPEEITRTVTETVVNPEYRQAVNKSKSKIAYQVRELAKQKAYLNKKLASMPEADMGKDLDAMTQIAALKSQLATLDQELVMLNNIKGTVELSYAKQLKAAGIDVSKYNKLPLFIDPSEISTRNIGEVTELIENSGIEVDNARELSLRIKQAADNYIDNLNKTFPDLTYLYTKEVAVSDLEKGLAKENDLMDYLNKSTKQDAPTTVEQKIPLSDEVAMDVIDPKKEEAVDKWLADLRKNTPEKPDVPQPTKNVDVTPLDESIKLLAQKADYPVDAEYFNKATWQEKAALRDKLNTIIKTNQRPLNQAQKNLISMRLNQAGISTTKADVEKIGYYKFQQILDSMKDGTFAEQVKQMKGWKDPTYQEKVRMTFADMLEYERVKAKDALPVEKGGIKAPSMRTNKDRFIKTEAVDSKEIEKLEALMKKAEKYNVKKTKPEDIKRLEDMIADYKSKSKNTAGLERQLQKFKENSVDRSLTANALIERYNAGGYVSVEEIKDAKKELHELLEDSAGSSKPVVQSRIYEVSSSGDRRFSALNAKLKDGRTIEEAYQLDVKGYRKYGNDWHLGKGKPPINKMTKDESYKAYKKLWEQWANENPGLVKELYDKSLAVGKTLNDEFARTEISQARALTDILKERFVKQTPLNKLSDSLSSQNSPIAHIAQFATKDGQRVGIDETVSPEVAQSVLKASDELPEPLKKANKELNIVKADNGKLGVNTEKGSTVFESDALNDVKGVVAHESAHAVDRTMSKGKALVNPERTKLVNTIKKEIGDNPDFSDLLEATGDSKNVKNAESVAKFAEVMFGTDSARIQKIRESLPKSVDAFYNFINKAEVDDIMDEVAQSLPPRSVARVELESQITKTKEMLKTFEGVLDNANKQSTIHNVIHNIDRRIKEFNEKMMDIDYLKKKNPDSFKDVPEFVDIEKEVHETILKPLALGDKAASFKDIIQKHFKEWADEEGIEALDDYVTHLLNWDLKQNKKASKLYEDVFNPFDKFGVHRKLDGTIDEINKMMAEKYGDKLNGKPFFETLISRIYMERGLYHANFMFDKEYADQTLKLFGKRIDKGMYDSLESPEAKQKYWDEIQKIIRDPNYTIVKMPEKYNAVDVKTLDNSEIEEGYKRRTVKRETARLTETDNPIVDELRYGQINNPYIEIDPKQIKKESFFEKETTPVYIMPKDAYNAYVNSMKKQFDKQRNGFLRVFDKIMSTWKAGAIMSPGFHATNLMGNMFNSTLEIGAKILDPQLNTVAAILQRDSGGKGKFMDKTMDEWREILKQYGMKDVTFFTDNMTEFRKGELDSLIREQQTKGHRAKDILNRLANPMSDKFIPRHVNQQIGSAIESQARIVNFLAHVQAGKSYDEAADLVNKVLFDYQDLTSFEHDVMKRLVPFYTWIRKNTPLQIEKFMEDPTRYAHITKTMRNINPESEEEQRYKPDYMKGMLHTGKNTYRNLKLPFQDVAKVADPSDMFSSANPLIKMAVELGANKNFFLDRPIDEGYDVKAPGLMKLIGKDSPKGKLIDPKIKYILQSMMPGANRINDIIQANSSNATASEVAKVNRTWNIGQLSQFSFDTEQQKESAMYDYVEKLLKEVEKARKEGRLK